MIADMPDYEPEGFSHDIFKQRYAFTEEETWEKACSRVAHQMALAEVPDKVEKYEAKFEQILRKNLFVPGGRILYGAGRPNPAMINCFTLTPGDSKAGWGELLRETTITLMDGGGVGSNYGLVRPAGSSISGQRGTSSGPLGLMKGINSVAEMVKAGGNRRSALMMSLDLDHPDIISFLDAKLKNGELSFANISVKSTKTSEFKDLVESDGQWGLSWSGKYKKDISAKGLWDRIVGNAWNKSEPGFINFELVTKESPSEYHSPVYAVNPCLGAYTKLLTPEGYKPIGELPKECTLVDARGESVKATVWSSGKKKVVEVRWRGKRMTVTPDHKFLNIEGEALEAKDLRGHRVMPHFEVNKTNDLYSKLGFVQGDGSLTRLHSPAGSRAQVSFGKKDGEVWVLFGIESEKMEVKVPTQIKAKLLKLGFVGKKLPERTLPTSINTWLPGQQLQFFRGLFSANGHVSIGSRSIQLKSTCSAMLTEIQDLLGSLGIVSGIYLSQRAYSRRFKPEQREYQCKESFKLVITKHEDLRTFIAKVGFIQNYKTEALIQLIKNTSPKVTSVSIPKRKLEEVFDFNLQGSTHWGVAEGLILSNCGEQFLPSLPGQGGGSCCLGHLVLTRFIKYSKANNPQIDWELMGHVTRLAIRFLDNVLDMNAYPLRAQKDQAQKERRVGLGFTGLGDFLTILGFRYGSARGNEVLDKLSRFMAKQAYEGSVMLAVEKGSFPACVPEKHVKTGFVKRMTPKIKALILEHGIRNTCLLSTAPTGTVSILSGNCSSGLEPMFAPAYYRNFFLGKERQRELCFHPLFLKALQEGTSLDAFIPAKDISPREHMEVQKVLQRNIDGAVSKTITIPKDYPVEELSKIWLEYLPYLKGTTFYREGSRNFVDDDGIEHDPPLVAIPVEEAIKLYKAQVAKKAPEVKAEAAYVDDCPNGTCEI